MSGFNGLTGNDLAIMKHFEMDTSTSYTRFAALFSN
jgi:hypothetical protein